MAAGCSSPTPGNDAAPDSQVTDVHTTDAQQDTGSSDVQTTDVQTPVDAGTDSATTEDTGVDVVTPTDVVTTDTVTPADTGVVADSSTCPAMGIGQSCSDTTMCPPSFMCDLGRCIPQGRQTCGGFAMARCTDPVYNQCLFQNGHGDVGTCFSPGERSCLCEVASDTWQCR